MTSFIKMLGLIAALASPVASHAETLAMPETEVILTVSGAISHSNIDGTAQFDMQMLTDLDGTAFETTTIWTDGVQVFEGVALDVLMDQLGVTEGTILATAINDYTVEIPVSDAVEGGPMVAYKVNGDTMSVRDKGPLWVVYPYDGNADYRSEVIYARSIWQLDRMEIVE
ncbi:molybdopterin-dependent oxidoreductase [Yoonia sp. BS5-3]|uniref:Molybdopterin-dependent oxidoreductase n=1 Tax=Yoonia phaeophyticola TaxID=3137369 RepID=A0ABZ2V023_9RHOB